MREILFKAKRIDNGEWVEGMPVVLPSKEKATMVCSPRMGEDDAIFADCIHINPETVCQYTGLTDKNGAKIFEGDKCEFSFRKYYEQYDVFCDADYGGWYAKAKFTGSVDGFDAVFAKHCEIIGNIHDAERS